MIGVVRTKNRSKQNEDEIEKEEREGGKESKIESESKKKKKKNLGMKPYEEGSFVEWFNEVTNAESFVFLPYSQGTNEFQNKKPSWECKIRRRRKGGKREKKRKKYET